MTVPGAAAAAADTVTALLQNASDLLAASLDSVSARLAEIGALHPHVAVTLRLLLLPPPAEGADFDPAALRDRAAHAALCLAEMLFFIFAIAFFKRFFNLEIVVGFRRGAGDAAGQRNLLLDELGDVNRRNSLLSNNKAVKSGDEDEDPVDESPSSTAAPVDDSSDTPKDLFQTANGHSSNSRTRTASSSSSTSYSLSDLSSLSAPPSPHPDAGSDQENLELEEENDAAACEEDDEEEEGASTVPTSDDRQSTDNAVLTFDSNHLAASSQYDRSDCGIDEDEEPTSFFDNDELLQPPRSDFGQGDPAEGLLQTNKRKRTTVVFPDPDDGFRCSSYEDGRIGGGRIDGDAWRESAERLPAIRDSSFDSGLSWFQEHYGRVWNAEDCESDSVASSSSSCSR